MSRIRHKGNITFSGTFPANPYPGQMGSAPRWPLLASAPANVANSCGFRLAGGGDYGTEYLGVSGSWVQQANVTMVRYQRNYVGYLDNSGTNTKLDSVLSTYTFNPNQDFELQLCFNPRSDAIVSYSGIFCTTNVLGSSAFTNRSLWMEKYDTNNRLLIRLYTSSGSSLCAVAIEYVADTVMKLMVKRVSNVIYTYMNGVLVDSATVLAGVANTALYEYIGSQPDAKTFNSFFCGFKLVHSGGTVTYDFKETEGNTVYDKTGSANGTLIDGSPATFHSQGWVPQS